MLRKGYNLFGVTVFFEILFAVVVGSAQDFNFFLELEDPIL